MGILCITLKKEIQNGCSELTFAKVTFDRMVMTFFIKLKFVIFSLFAMQLDYCNIGKVFDHR
jgi:hypothetical protein